MMRCLPPISVFFCLFFRGTISRKDCHPRLKNSVCLWDMVISHRTSIRYFTVTRKREVPENNKVKQLWLIPIQAGKTLEHNKSDIVLLDKQKKELLPDRNLLSI